MNDKQIKNILLKLLTENHSKESAQKLLGGLEGIKSMNWKRLPNSHLADFANVKCPLKSICETLDNHEDAITEFNRKNYEGKIDSLQDVFKMNSKLAGQERTSVRWHDLKNSNTSPYSLWNNKHRVDLVFGHLDKKGLLRNLLTMDTGIGLSYEEAENTFLHGLGKSKKQENNFSRGVLGIGESAPLKHCFIRATATRKRGVDDMVLGLTMYMEDPSLIASLKDDSSRFFPVAQLLNQSGRFFKINSEELIEEFKGDYLKFIGDDEFQLNNTKSAPKKFEYGFLNRFIGYHMPNIEGCTQIAQHPETNFNKFLNAHNEIPTCPMVVHEANPTTRKNKSTGASIYLKGFNVKFDCMSDLISSTSFEITAKFKNNSIGQDQNIPIPGEVAFKKSTKGVKHGIHILIRGKVFYCGGLEKVLRKKAKQPLTKAEKDVCNRMVARVDLSNIPQSLTPKLLTGDKSMIDRNNSILIDLLDQLRVVFDTAEFKSALAQTEKEHMVNSHRSASFEKAENTIFQILNSKSVRISSNNTITSSSNSPLAVLNENPSYIDIFKDKYKIQETAKHATILFKTDAKKDFFLNERGDRLEDINLSISYNDEQLLTGVGYSHGVLKLTYNVSKVIESLSIGDVADLGFHISKTLGSICKSGVFKLELIADNKNNTHQTSNSQGNSRQLRKGTGNQTYIDKPKGNFKYYNNDEYINQLTNSFKDEQFKKALREQYPNMGEYNYIKSNIHYWITKNSSTSYDVLVNTEELSYFMQDGELSNNEIFEIIVKNSIRICMHEDILLSDNFDLFLFLKHPKNSKLLTT